MLYTRDVFAGEPTKPLPAIGLTRVTRQRVPMQNLRTYPSGKIFVPESAPAENRFALLPVVVTNCWDSVPLYSFRFSVEYDFRVLHVVDVLTVDSVDNCHYKPFISLAKDFFLTYTDGPGIFPRRITITGISSTPLALTTPPGNNCAQSDTVDLLYIKFQVVARSTDSIGSTILRIPNNDSSLIWGSYSTKDLFPTSFIAYPLLGLCGPDSIDATGTFQLGTNNLVSGRGMGNLVVTKQPSFTFRPDSDFVKLDDHNYVVRDVFFADSGSVDPQTILTTVVDTMSGTLVNCVTEQNSQPWWVLGSDIFYPDPFNRHPDTSRTTSFPVYIIADPNYFAQQAPYVVDSSGVYTGIVTFINEEASNSPINIRANLVIQPSDINVKADSGRSSAVVNYFPAPISTDGSYTLSYNPPTGSTFPVGITPVILIVITRTGKSVTRTFNVTVVGGPIRVSDNQPLSVHEVVLRSISPNPVTNQAILVYEAPCNSPITIDIVNSLGMVMNVAAQELRESETHSISLDTRILPIGMYWARAMLAGKMSALQMMIVR